MLNNDVIVSEAKEIITELLDERGEEN